MFPVEQILRGGMTPGHVLPCRGIRVVLIIEMPESFLLIVEHTIRVVHPAPLRGVVEERTILVGIAGIIAIDCLNLIPCNRFIAVAHVEMECIKIQSLQVQWYIIVNLAFVGKTDNQ